MTTTPKRKPAPPADETPADAESPTYLTVAEVAGMLRVNVATVRRWCAEGTIPALQIGRDYRIELTDLRAVLNTRRTSTRTATPLTLARVINP